jgi:uncharacterized protein VirK/YbjX
MTLPYLHTLARVAGTVYPETTWGGLGQRALFVIRSLCHYSSSRLWLEYLATERMTPIVRANPSLYRKSIRPYVSIHWPQQTKVEAMIHHYEFLARWLTPTAFHQAVSPAGCVVHSFPTKSGDQLTIRLRYEGKFRKEGEATLELESAQHGCGVCSLTFVVAADETGAASLVIGAVFGLPAGANKDIIKHVTKSLSGLRPKALLLLVLQDLARVWDVKWLLGVGSRIHTSRHLAYALNRSRRFTITYDEFWREVGGAQRRDGFFVLPLVPQARNLGDLPSHKRSLYRHRYALIDDLLNNLRGSLSDWQSAPPKPATPRGVCAPPRKKPRQLAPYVTGLLCLAALVSPNRSAAATDARSGHGLPAAIPPGRTCRAASLDVLPEQADPILIRAYDDPASTPTPPAERLP